MECPLSWRSVRRNRSTLSHSIGESTAPDGLSDKTHQHLSHAASEVSHIHHPWPHMSALPSHICTSPSTFDEDIATLDTPTPWSSPSCNSFSTQLPRRPQIQQTRRHCFGHNFLIPHRNGPFLDALERGRRRRRFGSGPSSRRFRGSFCVTTARCCVTYLGQLGHVSCRALSPSCRRPTPGRPQP